MKVAAAITAEIARQQAIPHPLLDAFLFDVDGVLADTAELHTLAWARLAREEQLDFDEACANSLRGVSHKDSLRRILNGRLVPVQHFKAMLEQKNQYYVESLARLGPTHALPGVRMLLGELSESRLRLAAVSASRNAQPVLEQIELAHFFEILVDGNAHGESNRYQIAAMRLGVSPQRCVVIEDSAAGLELATQLGMLTIGLCLRHESLRADLILNSLAGASARALLADLASLQPQQSSIL